MTLREKVGQLLMVGFPGPTLSGEDLAWIQEFRPGGIILFSRNLIDAHQIAELTATLQKLSSHNPLLIAVDQEGGQVSRLPKEFTIFPPAATVARCQSSTLAYEAAAVTAKELKAVGINMNMAPVLDVNTNPANPIIGDRAFGETPELVCVLGLATMSGLQDHGVVACGKHFPGHGETVADSHLQLPVVELTKDRLESVEFRPFRHTIERGLATIMTAHVRYPALDSAVPATLSSPILTGILRHRLGFQGLIFTDDLEMQAILDHWSIADAAVKSLQAGADILLICHQHQRQTEAVQALEDAIASGDLTIGRIDESLARIHHVKEQYVSNFPPINVTAISEIVGSPMHRQLVETILQTATTSESV